MAQARFIPTDVFQIKGRGTVVTGSLITGVLAPGMSSVVQGSQITVKEIETFKQKLPVADASSGQLDIGVLLHQEIAGDVFKPLAQSQIPVVFEGEPIPQPLAPEPVVAKKSGSSGILIFLVLAALAVFAIFFLVK